MPVSPGVRCKSKKSCHLRPCIYLSHASNSTMQKTCGRWHQGGGSLERINCEKRICEAHSSGAPVGLPRENHLSVGKPCTSSAEHLSARRYQHPSHAFCCCVKHYTKDSAWSSSQSSKLPALTGPCTRMDAPSPQSALQVAGAHPHPPVPQASGIFGHTCTPQRAVVTCFKGTADDVMKCLESAHIHSAALKLRIKRTAKQGLPLQQKYTAVREKNKALFACGSNGRVPWPRQRGCSAWGRRILQHPASYTPA